MAVKEKPGESDRRPTLADLLLLVPVLAMGLTIAKTWPTPNWPHRPGVLRFVGPNEPDPSPRAARLREWLYGAACWVSWSIPTAMVLAPALIARTLTARPARRARLIMAPGFAACVAATTGLLAGMALASTDPVLASVVPSPPFRPSSPPSLTYLLREVGLEAIPTRTAPSVAAAVLAAWIVLAVGRRTRPNPDPLDGAGRLLGCYWVMLPVACAVLETLLWHVPR